MPTPNTSGQNKANSAKYKGHGGKRCSSRFKGVSWHRRAGRWQAYIRVDGELEVLGAFVDEIEAAAAYNAAAIARYGPFAALNDLPVEST